MLEGYGACLINKPEMLRDVVLQTRNRIPSNDFTVSIKIRIHPDIRSEVLITLNYFLILIDSHLYLHLFRSRETIDLCQKVEKAGVSFFTVHGRTKDQRTDPVNYEAIKLIKSSVRVPVIANGDIFSLADAEKVQQLTSVDGK